MVGISSYGTYIPTYRIRASDIACQWGKSADHVKRSLGVSEKSVPGIDEDAVTIAVEAAAQSLQLFDGKPSDVDMLFVGSESHPYAVNPTSTIVGQFVGVDSNYLAADLQFACKAATAGVQASIGLLEAKRGRNALVIGADAAQSRPHDTLEYTSAAAGVACILGRKHVLARIVDMSSFSSDAPDFWRRDGIRFPSHAGRFTGEPAYFAHIIGAASQLMKKARIAAGDVQYCVFHMPNGKLPRIAAKRLGFTKNQLEMSLTVDHIGNPYSASTLLGLARVLDVAKPGEKIFMVSYGSGAGSDAFLWEVTDRISSYQKLRARNKQHVSDQIQRKKYIDYATYLKYTRKM